ncbi:glycoside hydrolase family 3 protein [Microbacterium sp. ASV81]|uniref:Glycoside hydrolase family 3 N-terminal domain-containing protein n=1 Tax=Microbacterium capsulatum TaxID=3041921 RepID=A0ABU0XPL6_9MICO|nr:glycoside hydrolase family 3 N-terminal domain-containing protein [Microbacterium sp. ASV81]MDQ4215705.1 glycoside hydrolase family 3 N-terminal domain-containing protein [Microbacterium sp. ASV81]
MTVDVERLANGVLWPGFLGTEPPAWLDRELRAGLAGVVYFAQNIGPHPPALSAAIRTANPRALIGVDEEGGSVTRLEAATGSTAPGAAQLGAVDDVAATRGTGAELGRRVRAAGADVLLGPVADVNTDPRNPVIGVRAFGADADLVSRHTAAEVEGIQSAGVAACVKHFPGHGDTHVDSHHGLPRVELDPSEIDRVHLAPFRAAIAAGVLSVMTAHIVVPAWGTEPATLNPRVLGLLRAEGFDGVIVTDALDMAAIRESVGIGGGAVRALAAGADLLCIGNPTNPGDAAAADQDEQDFRAARDAIVAALQDGTLAVDRVAEAGARVARLAGILAAARSEPLPAPAGYDAAAIVRRSLGVHGDLGAPARGLVVLDARRRATLAVDSAGAYVVDALAGDGWSRRVDTTRVSAQEAAALIAAAGAAAAESGSRIVVLVDRLDTDGTQRAFVDAVAAVEPGAVVVNAGLDAGSATLPVVEVRASSRIGAEAARELLAGG